MLCRAHTALIGVSPAPSRSIPKICSSLNRLFFIVLPSFFSAELYFCHVHFLGGTSGAMLQHLVGAKLDVVLGKGMVQHYGSSVADLPTERKADFQIEAVAIHVTTNPSEALIGKCAANLQDGLKPVVITNEDGVSGAAYLLRNAKLLDRVDVLDIGQFLTANIYERSLFKSENCRVTLSGLLQRYNEIVGGCETDPSLRINLGDQQRTINVPFS